MFPRLARVLLDPGGGWRRFTVTLTCLLRLMTAKCTADAGDMYTQTRELCKLSDVLHNWRWSWVMLAAGERASTTRRWSGPAQASAGKMYSTTGAGAMRTWEAADVYFTTGAGDAQNTRSLAHGMNGAWLPGMTRNAQVKHHLRCNLATSTFSALSKRRVAVNEERTFAFKRSKTTLVGTLHDGFF